MPHLHTHAAMAGPEEQPHVCPQVRVPDVRRAELQQLVANHFQLPPGTVPTQEQLAEAADLDPRKPISEWCDL